MNLLGWQRTAPRLKVKLGLLGPGAGGVTSAAVAAAVAESAVDARPPEIANRVPRRNLNSQRSKGEAGSPLVQVARPIQLLLQSQCLWTKLDLQVLRSSATTESNVAVFSGGAGPFSERRARTASAVKQSQFLLMKLGPPGIAKKSATIEPELAKSSGGAGPSWWSDEEPSSEEVEREMQAQEALWAAKVGRRRVLPSNFELALRISFKNSTRS